MTCVPCIERLEIHVTYRCNLRCAHCHNLVGAAPCNEDMTLDCLKGMLDESVALKYQWKWLVLHGGEPTMHPEFRTICQMLAHYKQIANPDVELKLTTNGHGPHNDDAVKVATEYGFEIYNSKKDGSTPFVSYHAAVLSSPTDTGEPFTEGCYQSSECGICFTPRGFYECSPAGAAWRVLGYKPLCKSVRDITVEKMAEGFQKHCRHCGYARTGTRDWKMAPETPISLTWAVALEEYQQRMSKET